MRGWFKFVTLAAHKHTPPPWPGEKGSLCHSSPYVIGRRLRAVAGMLMRRKGSVRWVRADCSADIRSDDSNSHKMIRL